MKNLLIEAFVVGIIVLVIGSIVGYGLSKVTKTQVPESCKDWNKNHIMEWSLFLTGVATHLGCELVGLNKYYCKNGVACSQ